MAWYDIVVIGASLGGLRALLLLLSALTADFPLPIAVAQHRSKEADDGLAAFLQHYSPLMVQEVEDKQPLIPSRVYLAPADYHLLAEPGSFALSTEAPVLSARPSIDVLFESAADSYAERAIGIILTGASNDGARGLAEIKRRGGLALVQDPRTAESDVMPLAAIAATRPDHILPIAALAPFLVELCRADTPIQQDAARRTQDDGVIRAIVDRPPPSVIR